MPKKSKRYTVVNKTKVKRILIALSILITLVVLFVFTPVVLRWGKKQITTVVVETQQVYVTNNITNQVYTTNVVQKTNISRQKVYVIDPDGLKDLTNVSIEVGK